MNRFHWILAGLAMAQGIAIFSLGTTTGTTPQEEQVEGQRPFRDLGIDDIGTLTLSDRDDTVVIERQPDRTFVVQNRGGFPAKTTEVERTVEALRKLYLLRLLTRDPKRFVDLEVDDARHFVKVEAKDPGGKVLGSFLLGERGSFDSLAYRKTGTDEVFGAAGVSSFQFGADVSSWIETRFVEMEKDQIRRVDVTRGDVTYALVGTRDSTSADTGSPALTWSLEDSNGVRPADKAKVDGWLSSLATIYISAPWSQESKPEFGLEPPAATVKVTLEDGTEQVLKLGSEREGTTESYLLSSHSPYVVTIREYTQKEVFQKGPEAFGDAATPGPGGGP